uniref:RRM domain-containing protein n=1 Tax=Timema bartmani TaxID=61472 RepID=A0A7R9EQY2_9NEOP|nr:unnamed protein product [Timema bartmani]
MRDAIPVEERLIATLRFLATGRSLEDRYCIDYHHVFCEFVDIRTSSTPPKTKIFVGRLPEDAQAADLRRLFEQYGVVTECDILNRYGFVHMKTEEMATRAIQELNNADFMGVQISVEMYNVHSRLFTTKTSKLHWHKKHPSK